MKRRTVLICLPLVLLAGCARQTEAPASAPNVQKTTGEVQVAAAADLTDVFTEIGKSFERETGAVVQLTFGATGQLATQIESGAPFEVFAAANAEYVERLEKGGKTVSGTSKVYALGKIALWTKPGSPLEPKAEAASVLKGAKRIAIANPETAPYGKTAKEYLQQSGLWTEVSGKLVFGENVRQVRLFAQTGNVDAAILPVSLMRSFPGRVVPLSDHFYIPLRQTLVLLKKGERNPAALSFLRFVLSRGRDALKRHGFDLPK